ncbi:MULTISPECIES: arsenite efflux transporter metallochaperone ArsD [Thioalkalivibrio]|uniref:Arsenical resistance operon transcriptional repressor ArsD n=1 Tax=Thioalkalivibrio halophilus TaxID=252474 RepID=A0A1V3A369_9GAMM|nr:MULTISPECIES: arsenite efflux transporter metallochaperone ArsD [Thioalkalivibrio]OOC11533.1 arsenical resistance operon transcriptional repressor ArsD [Thioalkalivibrio halophilus]
MTAIRVYDPSMCCNTGVCGADVDQRLVDFAADVRWAQDRGADVERMNLAQQPTAFAENPKVRAFLEEHGEGGLPLILVDGEAAISGRYPDRAELAHLAGIPAPEEVSGSPQAGDGCCGPARDTGCC